MRKTFCSRGNVSNSIYNGIFSTDIQLSVGNIVKIKNSRAVVPFSSDYIVTSYNNYTQLIGDSTTIIDLIIVDNIIYMLGATSDTYFIRKETFPNTTSHNYPLKEKSKPFNLIESSTLILGKFHGQLSLSGNIIIRNGNIHVLVYHDGSYSMIRNKKQQCEKNNTSIIPLNKNRNNGLLINISLDNFKIIGFRNLPLTTNFLLFGGLEEYNREEFLFLLNDNNLLRFNPGSSYSWNRIVERNIVSASTTRNLVLLLRNDSLEAIDQNTGISNWVAPTSPGAKCCVCYDSNKNTISHDVFGETSDELYQNSKNFGKVFIVAINTNIINITQAYVDPSEFRIISTYEYVVTEAPKICGISTLGKNKYVVWSEKEIRIFNENNKLLSTTNLENISIPRTYRLLPRHLSEYVFVAINGEQDIYINNINTFTAIDIYSTDIKPYAGFFIITEEFPKTAGIVTDIIDNKVYVVFNGAITNILTNLDTCKIYMIDICGNLIGNYHNINQDTSITRPFLITGIEHNQAFIVYNG